MIKIAPEKIVSIPNGDKLGYIWSTFNLDLHSNRGHLRISPRTIITTNDITDLGVPVAFDTFTDQNAAIQYAWSVAGSYVFRMNLANGYQTAFAKDASTGTPTSCSSDSSDMAHFGSTFMVVTVSNDIFRYNASSGQWNDGANELTSGGVHMLCVYGTRFYVTDESVKIKSFTPANYAAITTSGSNTLNLGNKGWELTSISTIRPTSNRIWVGTINQSENGCWVFAWDGATANDPTEAYYIKDASGVVFLIIKNDTPWIIDNNARLMHFNGGSFVEAPNGKLPVKNTKLLKNSLSTLNDRWMHPNGGDIVDGKIRILINNEYEDNGATIEENIASGIWEYDPQVGWTHIMSLSLYTSSVNDYGQNRVSRVGALYANKTETTNASANGTMLMGAQLYSDATTTKEAILIDDSNDTLQKYGYFVTSKIYSDQLQDTWQKLWTRHKKLLESTDSITVKYRTDEEDPTEITITWVDTNTFTTTTNLLGREGDEVEILQGDGAGKCAHISSIDVSSGTYTVNLDDTFTGVTTNTAKARVQSWKKAGTCTDQTVKIFPFPIQESNTWIQLKVCMQFTGENEIDDIILINSTDIKAE